MSNTSFRFDSTAFCTGLSHCSNSQALEIEADSARKPKAATMPTRSRRRGAKNAEGEAGGSRCRHGRAGHHWFRHRLHYLRESARSLIRVSHFRMVYTAAARLTRPESPARTRNSWL